MGRAYFISGIKKKLLNTGISFRLFRKAISQYGFFKAFGEISRYYKDPRNVFIATPNRYLKSGGNTYALPDMPPLNTKDFIDYLIHDIDVVNHNKSFPLVFAILCISSRCPYKCDYCYNANAHSKEEKIPLEKLESTVQGLIDKGVKNIHLSGGEPMMRFEAIEAILKKFGNKNIGFWMLTTGWDVTKEKLRHLQSLGLRGLLVSMDTYDKEWINQIKRSKKAYDNAVNTIKFANELGLVVTLDSVINKALLEKIEFDKFIQFAKDSGAHFINCYTPRQIKENIDDRIMPYELEDYKTLAAYAREVQTGKAHKNSPIPYSPDAWEAIRGCLGGKLFIYIDPDGNVKPCPFINKGVGNIMGKDIREIIDDLKTNKIDHVCKANSLLMGEFKS